MDRSSIITLVSESYTTDSLGQRVPTETTKQVFCQVKSVTGTEWFAGGQNGIKPTYQFTVFKYDYTDEQIVIYNNKRYAVYRTYEAKNDNLELYVEEKAGV